MQPGIGLGDCCVILWTCLFSGLHLVSVWIIQIYSMSDILKCNWSYSPFYYWFHENGSRRLSPPHPQFQMLQSQNLRRRQRGRKKNGKRKKNGAINEEEGGHDSTKARSSYNYSTNAHFYRLKRGNGAFPASLRFMVLVQQKPCSNPSNTHLRPGQQCSGLKKRKCRT